MDNSPIYGAFMKILSLEDVLFPLRDFLVLVSVGHSVPLAFSQKWQGTLGVQLHRLTESAKGV